MHRPAAAVLVAALLLLAAQQSLAQRLEIPLPSGDGSSSDGSGPRQDDSSSSSSSSNIIGVLGVQAAAATSSCKPAVSYSSPKPQGLPIPALPSNQRPNFIVILTDDQGWDDIGLHNPEYVYTPNLDKFIQKGTLFDNFYTMPQCSQTRAALLTGRSFPRTGTLLVNGGYDFMNSQEVTIADIMLQKGYSTAHFGKWHNGQSLGYEPYYVGFEESTECTPNHMGKDCLLRYKGAYSPSQGYYEDVLMDRLLGYLQNKTQSSDEKPFFVFYAPHAIHVSQWVKDGKNRYMPKYDFPDKFKERYKQPKYQGIQNFTLQTWGMLEHLDSVLGRLFDFVFEGPLASNTYIMMMGDNGSEAELNKEWGRVDQQVRMPSLMQGNKDFVLEGGIRNFLTVRGPGVPAGFVDSTLLEVTDIMPTIVELAGQSQQQQTVQVQTQSLASSTSIPDWDGLSFKNLVLNEQMRYRPAGGDSVGTAAGAAGANKTLGIMSGMRGTSLASSRQLDRFVVAMSSDCWSADDVPLLTADRRVDRKQQLFDYEKGGLAGRGFERCMAVRYKNYKWLGRFNTVYRFSGSSHVELPCNLVTGSDATSMASLLSIAARNWWTEIVQSPHSFKRPKFYIGWRSGPLQVTNILAAAAQERTPGNVVMLGNGVAGFKDVGDRLCFRVQVQREALYKVTAMYTSQEEATFKLSVGTFAAIMDDTVPSITVKLPVRSVMKTMALGDIYLTPPAKTDRQELCFQLIERPQGSATPIFTNLSAFRLRPAAQGNTTDVHPPAALADCTGDCNNTAAQASTAGDSSSQNASGSLSGTRNIGIIGPVVPAEVTATPGPVVKSESSNAVIDTVAGLAAWRTSGDDDSASEGDAPNPVGSPGLNKALTRRAIARQQRNRLSRTAAPQVASDGNATAPDAIQQDDLSRSLAVLTAAPEPGFDLSKEYSWLRHAVPAVDPTELRATAVTDATAADSGSQPAGEPLLDVWTRVRLLYGWPDGQGVLESMYTPYATEGLGKAECDKCWPDL